MGSSILATSARVALRSGLMSHRFAVQRRVYKRSHKGCRPARARRQSRGPPPPHGLCTADHRHDRARVCLHPVEHRDRYRSSNDNASGTLLSRGDPFGYCSRTEQENVRVLRCVRSAKLSIGKLGLVIVVRAENAGTWTAEPVAMPCPARCVIFSAPVAACVRGFFTAPRSG